MRIMLLTCHVLLWTSTLSLAVAQEDRTIPDPSASFSIAIYHAGEQLPSRNPIPLVLEIENRSSDTHKLFAAPIAFTTRSFEVKLPARPRITLPRASDVYIEIAVERVDPADPAIAEISQTGLQAFRPSDFAPGETKFIKVMVPRSTFVGKRFKVTARLSGTDIISMPVILRDPERGTGK